MCIRPVFIAFHGRTVGFAPTHEVASPLRTPRRTGPEYQPSAGRFKLPHSDVKMLSSFVKKTHSVPPLAKNPGPMVFVHIRYQMAGISRPQNILSKYNITRESIFALLRQNFQEVALKRKMLKCAANALPVSKQDPIPSAEFPKKRITALKMPN